MDRSRKQQISMILLWGLVFLIPFSYHPFVFSISKNWGVLDGSVLSPVIIILFLLLFLLSANDKRLFSVKELVIPLGAILLYGVTLSISLFFGFKVPVLREIRMLMIPWMAMLVGYQLRISMEQYRMLLYFFIGVVLWVALTQIATNIGGFVILEQYVTENKNALGVVMATAATIALVLGLEPERPRWISILFLFLSLLLIISLLTIRARAAALIFMVVALYIFFKKFKSKHIFLVLIGFFVVAVLTYLFLPSGIKQFVTDSFLLNKEQDVMTDRMVRNEKAIRFLIDYPFFGNQRHHPVDFGYIHNYPLLKWYNYGFVGAFFVLFLYFYLLWLAVKNSFTTSLSKITQMGFLLLLIPYGISMAEPSLPFGPGTVTAFNFILFGLAIREKSGDALTR